MKLSFLELSSNERRLYIEQAAIHRNVSPVIMEKDFFVRSGTSYQLRWQHIGG